MSLVPSDLSYRPGEDGFLEGKMLIAMPSISDARFHRTVIYMCVHNPDGAMGIVVNKPADNITLPDLLDRLSIRVPGKRLPKAIQLKWGEVSSCTRRIIFPRNRPCRWMRMSA